MRCELAAALIHDPAVLYLDEPTIGMDVVVKEQVREFLRDQVENRGRTVVLTTHDMTEVERLAERVILITAGSCTTATWTRCARTIWGLIVPMDMRIWRK